MSLLDKIKEPSDLRVLDKTLLPELAKEIREELIQTVSKTGGHLASSLGAVEIALAMHFVYDSPKDKFIWDVGHQAYAHKLLSGRKDRFYTQRTYEGISGFPKIAESKHDAFGVGHSSTSISAALGFAVARDLSGSNEKVVAVIGDGSMTGGLAFEGLQNAGHIGSDMLVILNDNEMFISHRVGAIAGYFAKLLTAGSVKNVEKRIEQFFKRMHFWGAGVIKVAKRFKVLLFPGMLFEEMGFAYLGPVDGHDLFGLIDILSNIKKLKGPVLLHVITKKGKGYKPAEDAPTKFHGIGRFNIITGESEEKSKSALSYTEVFSKTIVKLARENDKIIAITAAMPDGTGLSSFAKEFPKRFFDVGIAEAHALTFAAGLAAAGYKPVCAIYSTFMQRAYDQIIHDVALQNLNVVLAIDRAGLVGEDGPTHHGSFDLSYLRCVPNLTIMAPSNENELACMLKTAFEINGPVAIRYPRGSGVGVVVDENLKIMKVGVSEVLKDGSDVCFLAIGNMVEPTMRAAEILEKKNIKSTVINMRWLKPIDEKQVFSCAKKFKKIITVEDNSIVGGLYSAVSELTGLGVDGVLGIALPDSFVEHGDITSLRKKCGFNPESIAQSAEKFYRK